MSKKLQKMLEQDALETGGTDYYRGYRDCLRNISAQLHRLESKWFCGYVLDRPDFQKPTSDARRQALLMLERLERDYPDSRPIGLASRAIAAGEIVSEDDILCVGAVDTD